MGGQKPLQLCLERHILLYKRKKQSNHSGTLSIFIDFDIWGRDFFNFYACFMANESGEYDKTHIIGDLFDPAYIFFIIIPEHKARIIFEFSLKASCHVADKKDFFIACFCFFDKIAKRQNKIIHGMRVLLSYCSLKEQKKADVL